jgi:hypothetical protein
MASKKINEGCGCGGSDSSSNSGQISRPASRENDPSIGKMASLLDGRTGTINDSIRNSRGEVIGYVMNNDNGAFRVFKDKVTNIYESEGAMASLEATPGMGEVAPPTRDSIGSGDVFPALTAGTPAAKKSKKKKKEDAPLPKSVLDWNTFRKNMLKTQN